MNKTLAFVLIWSSFCFLATMAMFQLDLTSIAAVVCAYTLALCFPCRITVLLCLAASFYMSIIAAAISVAKHDDDED